MESARSPELSSRSLSDGEDTSNMGSTLEAAAKARRANRKSLGSSPPKRSTQPMLNAYGIPIATTTSNTSNSSMSKNGPARSSGNDLDARIRVCVRKRPLSRKEKANGQVDIAVVTGRRSLAVQEPK